MTYFQLIQNENYCQLIFVLITYVQGDLSVRESLLFPLRVEL